MPVFVRKEWFGDEDIVSPLPSELKYPNCKRDYPAIGVKINNESCNYDLLLLDVHTHGPHAEKHAIRIKAGKWKFYGGYSDSKTVGMCYKLKFVQSDCVTKNCAGEIKYSKALSIEEEYEKNC